MGAELSDFNLISCQRAGDLPAILRFAERFPRFKAWFNGQPELPEILRQWPRKADASLEENEFTHWPPDTYSDLRFMEYCMLSAQYEALAEKMNILFRDMSLRTRSEAWKRDGIGACAADVSAFNLGFPSEFWEIGLKNIWEDTHSTFDTLLVMGTREGHMACRFHAKGAGCILGNDKPPRCLIQFEQEDDGEIEALLDMSIADVENILQSMLEGVMAGKFPSPSVFCFPERNQDFAEDCLARLDDMIAQVRKAPIVEQPVFHVPRPIHFRAWQP